MSLLFLALVAQNAEARDVSAFTVGVGLVYAPLSARYVPQENTLTSGLPTPRGRNNRRRWGVELMASNRWAIGSGCTNRVGCGDVWPIAGPTASVTWRGNRYFGYSVGLVGGVGGVEVHSAGFYPEWDLDTELVWTQEMGTGGAFGVGAFVSHALAYETVASGGRSTVHGFQAFALSAGHLWRWQPRLGWADGSFRFRLACSPFVYDSYVLQDSTADVTL